MQLPIMKIPVELIRQVEDKVLEIYLKAESLYRRNFDLPSINWNLRGIRAGVAHVRTNRIRLNPILLVENTEKFIAQTVPHEIAHLINRTLNGPHVRPHGPEWKAIMRAFGLPPLRCHNYNVENSVARDQRCGMYCTCGVHFVSKMISRRVLQGWKYRCRRCRGLITQEPQPIVDDEWP